MDSGARPPSSSQPLRELDLEDQDRNIDLRKSEKTQPQHTVSSSTSPSATIRLNDSATSDALDRWTQRIWIGSGMIRDVRARAPYYLSDWTDAWNYRVIPAIVLIFFAK